MGHLPIHGNILKAGLHGDVQSDSKLCECGNAHGYACLLWVNLHMHLFILDRCCTYGVKRNLSNTSEDWLWRWITQCRITKKILVSRQGKPCHMQSHKLLSGVKTCEKNHEKERSLFQFQQCSNRPIATKLLRLMGVIPVPLFVRLPRKPCQLLQVIMTALRFLTWEVKPF